jgi:hypothetical protein
VFLGAGLGGLLVAGVARRHLEPVLLQPIDNGEADASRPARHHRYARHILLLPMLRPDCRRLLALLLTP